QKAITFYARDPESLNKVLQKVDEALAKHKGELPPIKPDGLDQALGESGRVAVVRDKYPAGLNHFDNPAGAQVDFSLADRIQADKSIPQHDAATGKLLRDPETGKLTDDGLRAVERKTGLKAGTLGYDAQGELMLKGTPGISKGDPDTYMYYLAE